jgi:putative DNA primase/helicase
LHFSPGQGWQRDETGQAYATLLEFARRLVVAGLEEAKTLENPQPFVAQLTRLKDRRRLDPALHLSTTDPRVVVRALDLDSRLEFIGCTNGILDVLTGKFTPFDQDVLVTRRLAVAFDPDAKAPTWERFLSEVQPDSIMRVFLQRLLGSALFGAVRDHILPFHHGTGANGKSTALEAVLDLFGGYGAKLTNSLVYSTRNGAPPYLELAGLFGARLAIGEENAQGGALNEELLKAITGGDRVKGRFHHANFIEGPASYKAHLVGNHKPLIAGTDDGIWRRFVLIPWPVSIPPERRDPLLRERISREAPGLLNWLVQGCIDWNRDGLRIPEACRALTNDFRQESDELADFIGEAMTRSLEHYCLKGEVYTAYKDWAVQAGLRPKTKRQLSTALQERGFESGRTSATRDHSWIGWTLNQQ